MPSATISLGSSGNNASAATCSCDEPGVGLVAVEGRDHVIAIGPGIGPDAVLVVSMGLGEVDDVHPVPRPSARRNGGSPAGDRRAARRRRATGSSRNAAISPGVGGSPIRSKERRRISVRRSASCDGRRPFSASLARMNRSIGVRRQPAIANSIGGTAGRAIGRSDHHPGRRWDGRCGGLSAQSLPVGREHPSQSIGGSRRPPSRGASPWAASAEKPSARRDRLEQDARLEITRHDRGPRAAPFADPLARVHPQPPFRLRERTRMAFLTTLDQHGADLGLEEGDAPGIIGRRVWSTRG